MGTKAEASAVGLGAGVSAAETLWTAEKAMNVTTTTATKRFIFNASIFFSLTVILIKLALRVGERIWREREREELQKLWGE